MWARMVIGECVSDEQVKQFVELFKDSQLELQKESSLRYSEVLMEEGGRMVIILTTWNTREACIQYHCSRAYRQFVARTQHLLIGDFVVKLFSTP